MWSVKYGSKSFIITEDREEIETNFQEGLNGQQYQIVHKGSAIRGLERVLCSEYHEAIGYLCDRVW